MQRRIAIRNFVLGLCGIGAAKAVESTSIESGNQLITRQLVGIKPTHKIWKDYRFHRVIVQDPVFGQIGMSIHIKEKSGYPLLESLTSKETYDYWLLYERNVPKVQEWIDQGKYYMKIKKGFEVTITGVPRSEFNDPYILVDPEIGGRINVEMIGTPEDGDPIKNIFVIPDPVS